MDRNQLLKTTKSLRNPIMKYESNKDKNGIYLRSWEIKELF